MRKLATIALLVSALFTGACVEDPDTLTETDEAGEREAHELPARPPRALHGEPLTNVLTQHADAPRPHVLVEDVLDGEPAPGADEIFEDGMADQAIEGQATGAVLSGSSTGTGPALGTLDCRNLGGRPDHGGLQGDAMDGGIASNEAQPRRPEHVHHDEPASIEVVRNRAQLRHELYIKLAGRR